MPNRLFVGLLGAGVLTTCLVEMLVWRYCRFCAAEMSTPFPLIMLLSQAVLLFLLPLPVLSLYRVKMLPDGMAGWLLGAFLGQLAFALAWGVPVFPLFWGYAILLSVTALMWAGGEIAAQAASCRPVRAAVLSTFIWLCFLSAPFWTGELTRFVENVQYKAVAQSLALWMSPLPMLSVAWPEMDLALLPRMYTVWLGPQPPYPSHPGWSVFVYGGVACFLWGIARVCAWWRPSVDKTTGD